MTVTRTPACTTRGCPAPKDPDWHIPFCGHGTEGHHHHVPKRSQGGKKIVAFLCPDCHDRVDNTPDWDNDITPGEDGKFEYILWDTRVEEGWNHPLIRRVLEAGSAAAERGAPSTSAHMAQSGPESAAAPSASGESGAAEGGETIPKVPPGRHEPPGSAEVPEPLEARSGGHPSAAPPSLETWCAEGMRLVYMGLAFRDAQDGFRFAIGDWFNKGEGMLGEEAYGYLRGFEDVTVRQYSWVAGRVGPDTRVSKLPWTCHRAVAALPEPEQAEWLKRAQEENLSSKDLSQAINPPKPKVRRWSLEELGFLCPACRAVLETL